MPKDKKAVKGERVDVSELMVEPGSVGEMLQAKVAQAKAEDDGPRVVCDFSEVSRRWAHEWMQLDGQIMQWSAVLQGESKDGLSDEDQALLSAGRIEAATRVNELMDRRNELVAMVLVDVPREWLVKGAPETIDWGDVDNLLDYVKDKYFTDLLQSISGERVRATKN